MSDVLAIVIGLHGDPTTAVPRDQLNGVGRVPSLDGLGEALRAAHAELVWLLAAGASATPDTLPPLTGDGGTPAVSLPVDAAGAPIARLIGRFADGDAGAMLDAARRRRAPLLSAPVCSLVVRREDALAAPAPEGARFGPYAGIAWTRGLFAQRAGALVPASRIRMERRDHASAVHALRAARAGFLTRGEALREIRPGADGRPGAR